MNITNMDNYTLSLDVTDYHPTMNLSFWLRYYEKNIIGKIHIVSFRILEETLYKNFNGEKFIWVNQLEKSFDGLNRYINSLEESDGIIIVGTERLTSYNNCKSLAEINMDGKTAKLHAIHDEDWSELSTKIDECYAINSKNVSGIIFICSINKKTANKLISNLEKSINMSIIQTESDKTFNNVIDVVLEEVKYLSLEDSLKHIKKNRYELNDETIEICKAIVYFNNGNIGKSIRILQGRYNNLTNEIKLFLSDLYLIPKYS